jgi:phosphoglucosamine mutase
MNAEKIKFGTDGIRGRFGQFPLDSLSIARLGYVLARVFADAKIVVGKDTRESGNSIENILANELIRHCRVESAHVLPTPGLSYLTANTNYDIGIMITASHNPFYDNGIKIFNANGEKISRETEEQIESFAVDEKKLSPLSEINLTPCNRASLYADFLRNELGDIVWPDLVFDGANGAVSDLLPQIFNQKTADMIACSPDGKNINRHCGSTAMEFLKEHLISSNKEFGFAFDGDGDRVLGIDRQGRILSGDHILYLLACYFQKTEPAFANQPVVGTVMSNLGLEKALAKKGISLLRTDVGDKYVYQKMKDISCLLGGEESGHIILHHKQKSGDGILAVIYVLKALKALNLTIQSLYQQLEMYPQQTKSILISQKRELANWPEYLAMEHEFNDCFGANSRLLVRYSGTEPKIRIMIESENRQIIQQTMDKFEKFFTKHLGDAS